MIAAAQDEVPRYFTPVGTYPELFFWRWILISTAACCEGQCRGSATVDWFPYRGIIGIVTMDAGGVPAFRSRISTVATELGRSA